MKRQTCPLGKYIKRGCRGCVEKMVSGYKDIPGCAIANYSTSGRIVLRLTYLRPDVIARHIVHDAMERDIRRYKQAQARRICSIMRSFFIGERLQQTLDMWGDGKTFEQIGRYFGVSKNMARLRFVRAVSRIRDCAKRYQWLIEEVEDCLC